MHIHRTRKSKLSIELAPLIDVVFQLLVFFMLASTFAKPAISMDLPKASTEDKQIKERIIIAIDIDENIFINNIPTNKKDLLNDLSEQLTQHQNFTVHIHGDKNVPYGTFLNIVDAARQAGAEHINLVHEQSKQ